MNEPNKNIWHRQLFSWRTVVVSCALVVTLAVLYFIAGPARSRQYEMLTSLVGLALVVAIVPLVVFLLVMCWRNLGKFFFGLACLLTLIALFYAVEDWRGWHTWHQFQQEWAAKGEHFDMVGVAPAPVPAEQNFALTPIVFTSYGHLLTRDGQRIPYEQRDKNFVERLQLRITHEYESAPTNGLGDRSRGQFARLENWQRYYRELAARTNEFAIPAQPGSPAADVLLALKKYDPELAELRAASRLAASRFPLQYTNESPASILLPHLAALKRCAQTLQLRSLAELQNHQPEQALDDVMLTLQLAEKIRTEPFLISHLVRIAIQQIALQPVWEGLARQQWSDAQLAGLERQLAAVDLLADYQLSMRGEMGCQGGEMDRLRRHPEQMQDLGGVSDGENNEPPLPGRVLAWLVPRGWFYQNQFRTARMMVDYYIPVADVTNRVFRPELVRRGDDALHSEIKATSPFTLLERIMLPALGNAARKFAWGQNSLDLARTAIALERYRLAHQEFPATLAPLAPQFIAKLPPDVIGGQPLHYRRAADGGFVLYSIGWNETDDGGVVGFKKKSPRDESASTLDIGQGDWVWRYPPK